MQNKEQCIGIKIQFASRTESEYESESKCAYEYELGFEAESDMNFDCASESGTQVRCIVKISASLLLYLVEVGSGSVVFDVVQVDDACLAGRDEVIQVCQFDGS